MPDVNLLLYALDPTAPRHQTAKAWLERYLSGPETVGFAWISLLGVIRLGTSSAIFDPPLEPGTALDVVDEWLAQPNATIVSPTDRHAAVLRTLLTETGTAGNLTTDAHLTALDVVDEWLAQPSATIVSPTDRHAAVLRTLLTETGTAGNLTTDAHLAALAIEHGATLASFDTDFHRFSGLKFEQLR